MSEVELRTIREVRMACIVEASKLKQNPTTKNDYSGKTVIEIAKELADYALGK